jgi:hypothetical protein
MTTTYLGRLEQVDLREAWVSEAGHFTPWLAKPENLTLLGDAIGIELECEAQEKDVGPFRADILCKDTATGSWVLIENQLEKTDHGHLGQLMTYAAGLKAVTIVWVAQRFTEEHRAALDWLNEITEERFGFFGLEIELWRIGDSPVAPKFNVVCKPNDWSRIVSDGAGGDGGPSSDLRQMQREYWMAFGGYLKDNGSILKPPRPLPHHSMHWPSGRSGFWLAAVIDIRKGFIRTGLYSNLANGKDCFAQLQVQKAEIEREFGQELVWDEMPGRKRTFIGLSKNVNLENREQWPEQFEWLQCSLESLLKVFRQRVRGLDAGEQDDDDGEQQA